MSFYVVLIFIFLPYGSFKNLWSNLLVFSLIFFHCLYTLKVLSHSKIREKKSTLFMSFCYFIFLHFISLLNRVIRLEAHRCTLDTVYLDFQKTFVKIFNICHCTGYFPMLTMMFNSSLFWMQKHLKKKKNFLKMLFLLDFHGKIILSGFSWFLFWPFLLFLFYHFFGTLKASVTLNSAFSSLHSLPGWFHPLPYLQLSSTCGCSQLKFLPWVLHLYI